PIRADRELAPERVPRLEVQLRPIPALGLLDPRAHGLKHGPVLRSAEERAAQQLEPVQSLAAEVVLPALQHGNVDLSAEDGGRETASRAEDVLHAWSLGSAAADPAGANRIWLFRDTPPDTPDQGDDMGFLDKLFGRKKQEPDQAESPPAAGAGMQEPAAGGTG